MASVDFIHPGISLGDRACLATGQTGGYRVVTGESKWLSIRRGVEVWLFREPGPRAVMNRFVIVVY